MVIAEQLIYAYKGALRPTTAQSAAVHHNVRTDMTDNDVTLGILLTMTRTPEKRTRTSE